MAEATTTTFKIEDGHPIPVGPSKFPLGSLEVGQSFVVPANLQKTLSVAATTWGRKLDRKFTVRKHGDAYRCWRVA